jgi:hypothetical protein
MTTTYDLDKGIDEYRRRTQLENVTYSRGSRRQNATFSGHTALPRANERSSHQQQTPDLKSDRLLGRLLDDTIWAAGYVFRLRPGLERFPLTGRTGRRFA